MAGSAAPTVDAYLAELPAERRAVVPVLDVVRRPVPAGYHEAVRAAARVAAAGVRR